MKYVVAVSGGVDSVVLLDMLVKSGGHELVIAHFDHGIREDSADDARFVKGLADLYGLPFEMKREELGASASEELARIRRYDFLRQVADVNGGAHIATAHHMNDLAETVAINLMRGTGWRGLAVLDRDGVTRPLLGMTKKDIMDYALQHNLEWCEDSTNYSNVYLRNRVRRKLTNKSLVQKLAELRDQQVLLREKIHEELTRIFKRTSSSYSRYFFAQIEEASAMECLQKLTLARLTRPQAERLLLAIKTQKPGSKYDAGAGIKIHFTTRHFSLEMVK